jgi:FMN phosphatase YigB (HAD superfamily)
MYRTKELSTLKTQKFLCIYFLNSTVTSAVLHQTIDTLQVVSPFQAILDYELSHGIPPGWVNNCISKTKPYGYWHRLERGEILMNSEWFAGFTRDLHSPDLWGPFYTAAQSKDPSLPKAVPPVPQIDGEKLFWEMMAASRFPDPWMFPALQALKKSGRYILAALSNTMIYPRGHPYTTAHSDVKAVFDLFISSAHIGMRKPTTEIYTYALRELDRFARENVGLGNRDTRGWENGVKAEEIVFLDDIGENLKAAKAQGFGTIKVNLGRAFEAVDQLEDLTGLMLAGNHPRIPVKPKITKPSARL